MAKKQGNKASAAAAAAKPKQVKWKLKNVEDAKRAILRALTPVGEYVELPIHSCGGMISAEGVESPRKLPPVDRSERDGYALKSADAAQPGAELSVVGEAYAGHPSDLRLHKGEATRIATGAVIPAGADAVVMFEDCEAGGEGLICVTQSVEKHQWIARAGSDFRKGECVVRAGETLTPVKLAAMGSMGFGSLKVLRPVKAAVFTTGDEVKKPGEELGEGDVYDGNTAGLVALLQSLGVDAKPNATVPDTPAKLKSALTRQAVKNDLIVFTGGTSVGDRDFGRPVLDEVGTTVVHGLNLKPGKPLLAGTIGSCLVIGLPGFPTSAMMVAYTMLPAIATALRGASSVQPEGTVQAELAEEVFPNPFKTFALPMRFTKDGRVESCFKGSAAVSTIARADAVLVLEPGNAPIPAGTQVVLRLT